MYCCVHIRLQVGQEIVLVSVFNKNLATVCRFCWVTLMGLVLFYFHDFKIIEII